MDLIVNPEFHNLIPPISPEEYQLLEASILREGCREAIITWDDCILDGHNRYEICQKHGIDFEILEKKFDSENEIKIWIVRNQLARRNLPLMERARLVLVLKPLIEEKAKERMLKGKKDPKQNSAQGETRDELAKIAGTSHDTISKVETIEKKAPEEIKEKVRRGEISINRAYQKTVSKKKPQQKIKPAWDKTVTVEFKNAFETFVEIIRKSKKSRWSDNPKSALRDCITILEGFST